MFLYSIASGVTCASVLLIVIVLLLVFVVASISGSVLNAFNSGHGTEWNIVFLLAVGLAGAIWGLTTVISMGYQQVDLFVTFITAVVTFFGAVLINAIIKGLSDYARTKRSYRKHYR